MVSLYFIVAPSRAQHSETELPCTYESSSDLLRGLRANEYCGNDRINYSAVSRYVERLDNSFWERAWIMGMYWAVLNNPENIGGALDPFRKVEIPYAFEDWAHEDRKVLAARSDELVAHMELSHGFLDDPDLQEYIESQLRTVVPNPMLPGRPGVFRVKILKSLPANAYALNTGTIIVTTGLLSAIESAEELKAVLAHEVAHVYLDHQIAALRASKRRQAWGAIIGVVAGAALSELAWRVSGNMGASISTRFWLSVGVDVASRYITAEVVESIGLKYSRGQEKEADQLAQLWLVEHGVNPSALVSVFQKARFDTLSSGSHPSATDRQSYLRELVGDVYGSENAQLGATLPADSTFMAAVAAAIIQQAEINLASGRTGHALALAQRATDVLPAGSSLAGAAAFMAAKTTRVAGTDEDKVFRLLAAAESSEATKDTLRI